MSRSYKFRDQAKPHFVSFAVVHWIDLFTRKEYCYTLIDSLKYCQQNKGLVLHAWIIMPSHVHLIISTDSNPMEGIMRDFKSFTSRKLKEEIANHSQESRKEWLIWIMQRAGKNNNNNNQWQLWQQNNQPIELWDNHMQETKLHYLHNNPVEAGIVSRPEDYLWSSAGDYAGTKGYLEIEPLQ